MVIAIGPLLLMRQADFWDGVIIDHAFRAQEFGGLRLWFGSSGWMPQYYLYLTIDQLWDITGLNHRVWIPLLTGLALFGVGREGQLYAERSLGVPKRSGRLIFALVLTFPIWHVFVSSVLVIHILCAWAGLAGYRFVRGDTLVSKGVGGVLVLLAMQLRSNLVFIPGLAAAELLREWLSTRRAPLSRRRRFAGLLALSAVVYAGSKLAMPPSGLYEGYNSILFGHPLRIALSFAVTTAWLAIAAAAAGVLSVLVLWVLGPDRNAEKRAGSTLQRASEDWISWGAAGCVLFIAAALPYAAVGKYPNIFVIPDWTHRHALLLPLPVALIVMSLISGMTAWITQEGTRARFQAVVGGATACIGAAVLLYTYTARAEVALFDATVPAALRSTVAPPSGTVHLSARSAATMHRRFYEANWLLWRAFGRIDWMVALDSAPPTGTMPEPPEFWRTLSPTQKRLGYLADDSGNCHTDLTLEGDPVAPARAWMWLFGLASAPALHIDAKTSYCRGAEGEPVSAKKERCGNARIRRYSRRYRNGSAAYQNGMYRVVPFRLIDSRPFAYPPYLLVRCYRSSASAHHSLGRWPGHCHSLACC